MKAASGTMVSLKVLTGAPVEVEAELCPVAASEFIAWLRAASEAIELAVGLTAALVAPLAALLTLASVKEPPLRIVLGIDAFNAAEANDMTKIELGKKWKDLSYATDFVKTDV